MTTPPSTNEYLMQIAMKVDISSDDSTVWDISDIASVLEASLKKLHATTEAEEDKKTVCHISHLAEFLRQYTPKVSSERVTSYFYKNGKRHWLYVGNVTDNGIPTKYSAACCYSPNFDMTGTLSLDHIITTEEGEFKVLGHVKFSSLKSTKHQINKVTMPKNLRELLLNTADKNHPTQSMILNQGGSTLALLKKKTVGITKKKKVTKKSGMASLIRMIAPGAGALLVGASTPQIKPHTSALEQEDSSPDEDDNSDPHRQE